MTSRAVPLLLLVSLFSTARADEQVRATQEELRRRNVYFGDIDGKHTPEMEEALKRFQHKKGLAASGHEDDATLRTLGLKPRGPNEPPPKEIAWPDEPVLKSDQKLDVGRVAQEVAAETGVAPASLAPIAMRPLVALAGGKRKPVQTAHVPPESQPTPGGAGGGQHTAPTAASTEFVRGYLTAMARGDLKSEMCMFADKVNYYGAPQVDRRIIEHSLRHYEALWTSRNYTLTRILSQTSNPRTAEITVTYEVKFSVKHRGAAAEGVTLNQIVLNAATVSPRIVSINETRVRR